KGSMVLFLDEIHRFSSSQQDSLLDAVEKGKIILIGATTENPAFRVNRALLSRCQIFRLDALDDTQLAILYDRCLSLMDNLKFTDDAKKMLLQVSGGDARRLFGIIEAIGKMENHPSLVEGEFLKKFLESQVVFYDKNKDYHYDFISAFIKSIRGSDPDAALFYLAGMLEGGEDPIFIMRRLIVLASEDVGNASVQALQLAVSGLTAIEKIGMPEGRIILSQVVTFLASCPKSNASYTAFESAKSYFKENITNCQIPNRLKNSPTFLHKKEGASSGYKYPHDYPLNFIEEFYFPDMMKSNPPQFYFPTANGIEKTLRDRLSSIWTKWKKYSN
ncbi:MAG: replication-associated recombination protein A, partial [Leptospiraceae bacterium]|nr:replication-associated recombination protein A [Leptospiraceae bacterium]